MAHASPLLRKILPVAVAAVLLAGCSDGGSDGDADESPSQATSTADASTDAATDATSDATSEAASDAATDLPTYEEVQATYLATADDVSKASCAKSSEVIDVAAPSGESYRRFSCEDIVRFEYVRGAKVYGDNYATAVKNDRYASVFHVAGELFVSPSGSDEDLAPAIQASCSCGEVVKLVLE